MRKGLMFLASASILFQGSLAAAQSIMTTENNCQRKKPSFYQEAYDDSHNRVGIYAAWHGFNENFKGSAKTAEVKDMLYDYSYDWFCVTGTDANRVVNARVRGILKLPDSSVIDGGRGRYSGKANVAFQVDATYYPQKGSLSTNNFSYINLNDISDGELP